MKNSDNKIVNTERRPISKKIFMMVFSLWVALMAGQMVLLPFVIFANFTNYGKNLPEFIGFLIVAIGMSLDIYTMVKCYKYMYHYLNKMNSV